MTDDIISRLRRDLVEQADTKILDSFHRFFKEPIHAYGVKTPVVSHIGEKYFREIKLRGKSDILTVCEELFKSDIMEEAFVAADWAYALHGEYRPEDFKVFEGWVNKYINNWAKCDSLCNHAVGALVSQFPYLVKNLKQWTTSKNRWVRRAAAVSLIIPARNGKFLEDIFQIADGLLGDTDDLVRKGYGWLLKEASRCHQQEVFEYIIRNKMAMPRTALRYAIEKMPEDLRQRAMEKPVENY